MPNTDLSRTLSAGSHQDDIEAITRHNVRVESIFSAFNGVFMGMILYASKVVAVAGLKATEEEVTVALTVITCAFPCGAFLGPLWAALGRRWGMKKLVTQMAVWANLPLFLMFWVTTPAAFTAVITLSILLYSAMRMGMSSMYRATYPREFQGRVLGRLTFWTFFPMGATNLMAGWLVDERNYPESYRWLFPLAAVFGLIGCRFYARIRPLHEPSAVDPAHVRRRSAWQGVVWVAKNDRTYVLFQLAYFLAGSAFFMQDHIIIKLAHERLDFGARELAFWMSTIPPFLLALCSSPWGRILDRVGMVRARVLISVVMTLYLAGYFTGIHFGIAALVCAGSVLRGVAESGGQLTWSLASVQFAPRAEDVPLYNGIHFVLNGIRGLVMPWIGTLLYLHTGAGTLLVAMLVSAISLVVFERSSKHDARAEKETIAAAAVDAQ